MSNTVLYQITILDIFSEFVLRIHYIILSILFFSMIFAIHNQFFKDPLYESKATILKSNEVRLVKGNFDFESNSLIENFTSDQMADLSRLKLLPSIVKSDVFIERILNREIILSNNDKRNIFEILTKDKKISNDIEKINFAKNFLKRSINFTDKEFSIVLKVNAESAELAQKFLNIIIIEIIELNALFKQNTLRNKRNTSAQKIQFVKENLLSQELKLETFLKQNISIDSPSLLQRYESLKREIGVNKEIYMQLSKYYDYLNVEFNSIVKNSLIILDQPSKPLFAYNKNLNQSIIRGGLFGLILSIFIILLSLFYIVDRSSSDKDKFHQKPIF